MCIRDRGGTTRRRRCAAAALAVGLSLTLSACGAMPRSGPVHKVVEPTEQSQQSAMAYNPQAPRPGASAQAVVEGFLAAGVGAQDDYSVARQYLTPQLATTWTVSYTHLDVYKRQVHGVNHPPHSKRLLQRFGAARV